MKKKMPICRTFPTALFRPIALGLAVYAASLTIHSGGGFALITAASAQTTGNTQPTRWRITNECAYDIWIQQDYKSPTSADEIVVKISPSDSYDYGVPDEGLAATRFWAKASCNDSGWNCGIGESVGVPDSISGGNQTTQTAFDAPIDSKFEATWGCLFDDPAKCTTNPSDPSEKIGMTTSWDASAVDGYTFAFDVFVKNDPLQSCQDQNSRNTVTEVVCGGLDPKVPVPGGTGQSCGFENLSSGGIFSTINSVDVTDVDLGYNAFSDGTTRIGCYSPCEILTSGQWLGLKDVLGGLTPESGPAQMYCCPTSTEEPQPEWSVSAEQCSFTGKVIDGQSVPAVAPSTGYVNSVHEVCNAYGYAYDDTIGLVNCGASVQYEMVFCPGGNSLPLPPERQPRVFCNSTVPGSMCPGDPPVDCPATTEACGTNPEMCKCPLSNFGSTLQVFIDNFELHFARANRIGSSHRAGSVTMFGSFLFEGDLDLSKTSITLDGVLDELDGVGELVHVDDLPMQALLPTPGSKPNAAHYRNPSENPHRLFLAIYKDWRQPDQYGFFLVMPKTRIPEPPEDCHLREGKNVTALSTRFLLEQAGSVQVAGAVSFWECRGRDTQAPKALAVTKKSN